MQPDEQLLSNTVEQTAPVVSGPPPVAQPIQKVCKPDLALIEQHFEETINAVMLGSNGKSASRQADLFRKPQQVVQPSATTARPFRGGRKIRRSFPARRPYVPLEMQLNIGSGTDGEDPLGGGGALLHRVKKEVMSPEPQVISDSRKDRILPSDNDSSSESDSGSDSDAPKAVVKPPPVTKSVLTLVRSGPNPANKPSTSASGLIGLLNERKAELKVEEKKTVNPDPQELWKEVKKDTNATALAAARVGGRQPPRFRGGGDSKPWTYKLDPQTEGVLTGFVSNNRYAVVRRDGSDQVELRALLTIPKSTQYLVNDKVEMTMSRGDLETLMKSFGVSV
jgi:hypothetical protein